MSSLAVLGNLSRDLARYADGRRFELLGGAALHVARAAAAAGTVAAPVSVIGTDLSWIYNDPRLAALDLSNVAVLPGRSCAFTLSYTVDGKLTGVNSAFGVAELLTSHCLSFIGGHRRYHVCCRRPLDVATVLGSLADAGLTFSCDFHLASAARLIGAATPFLPRAATVFVNADEFITLSALVDPARLAAIVVSDGPREAAVLRRGRLTATAQPPGGALVEVTGAGDTLAGAFLAGMACGLGDGAALQAAVTAATRSIRAPELAIPDK